jgi:hypothetical protein
MMEALSSSETSVLITATRHNIPEDGILQGMLSFSELSTNLVRNAQEKSVSILDKKFIYL